jgi:HTH-type transcriptional regulator / antitoxin HigA
MSVRSIRTEAEYDKALTEIAIYFERESEPGSPDAQRFGVLAAVVEAYEDDHWPIESL